MQRAIKGGVATIEHGSYMDEETMDLMKQYGTYLVPTITAGASVADSAKIEGYFPEIVRPKALAVGPQIQNTFAKAYKAGVNIAFGTDAGVFKHGKNAKEFKIGALELGRYADIVACSNNPLDDISELQRIIFVMKDGQIIKE